MGPILVHVCPCMSMSHLPMVVLVQIQDAHCPEYAPSWKNVPQFPAEEKLSRVKSDDPKA